MRYRVVLAGGIVAGVVDIAFAILFWLAKGVSPIRILQSIARGLLGTDAFAGGAATAALGLALHFAIAITMGVTYAIVARRARILVEKPLPCGLAYGVALYAIMNVVVLPLSAAGKPSFANTAWVASSIAVHAALGVIFADAARRADRHG